MQIKEFLNLICEEIKYKPIRNEIAQEIENHMEESKESFINDGITFEEAEKKAIEQMGNAEEIGKSLNKIHRPKLDWKLLIIVLIVLGFGILIITTKVKYDTGLVNSEMDFIRKYISFLIIGSALSMCIYFLDYRRICKYSGVVYIIATGIIIWALLFGANINGIPHIYFNFMIVSPSVIATPLYIIAFAGFLQNINKKSKIKIKVLQEKNSKINVIKIIMLAIVSLFLLLMIPSKSSIVVVGISYLIMATIKLLKTDKNKKRNLIFLWGIPTILLIVVMIGHIAPYQIDRVIATFNPESDPTTYGWLGINRKQIINSANIFGEAENMSNALNVFDEGTNYAFISILAHYGWIVSVGMVVAVIILSIKLIINSMKIKDTYGKLLIIGISSIFILQSLFNILMNLNWGIEADFNIPLVSYGGTNLMTNMISLALVFSIYRRKDILTNKTIEMVKLN